MNKNKSIEAILKAKEHHASQMLIIKKLAHGRDINGPSPTTIMECNFGKWLYNPKYRIKEILGLIFYEKMDSLHKKWHNEYLDIYKIFQKKEKKTFFSKITGNNKIKPMDVDRAKAYYKDLEKTSEKLLLELDKSHRRFVALSDSIYDLPST